MVVGISKRGADPDPIVVWRQLIKKENNKQKKEKTKEDDDQKRFLK